MDKEEQIRKKLIDLAKAYGPKVSLLAKVKEVDEDGLTCVLVDDDEAELEYPDVRLRPVIDGKEGITIYPKLNTWALAVRIEDDNEWMFIAAGEVDKVKFKAGDTTIIIDNNGVFINGGNNGGLVKIDSLVTDINSIKTDINNLKAAFTGWIVAPSDGGAALKVAAASWASQQLTATQKSNLENDKVKH